MTDDLPKPLVARVQPIPGETLISLLLRSCQANVLPHVAELLRLAGYTSMPDRIALTGESCARNLAALLSLPEGEITGRMHMRLEGEIDPDRLAWFGSKMERRFLEPKLRRVSPGALKRSPHQRAQWSLRPFSFCPETFEILIDRCAACSHQLGWKSTRGLTRCDRCDASLLEIDTPCIQEELRGRLSAAAALVSPDPADRARALADLPQVFHTWDPGEVFCALVELGVAWENPAEGRGSFTADALARGSLQITPQMIASGYDACRRWPTSLANLLARACAASLEQDDGAVLQLAKLTVLSRHFHVALPATNFRRLLRGTWAYAALDAKAPVRFRLPPEARINGALTLNEAASSVGISAAVLGRLAPAGECFLVGRTGRGGSVLLKPDRLQIAARAYLNAVPDVEAAAQLGLPSFMVTAFKEAGLLTAETDADALLMARGPLTQKDSLQRLLQRLSNASRDGEGLHSLQRSMAGWMQPEAWVAAAKLVLSGEVRVNYLRDPRDQGIFDQIILDPEVINHRLHRKRFRQIAGGFDVNAVAAALLLGVQSPYIPGMIKRGLLSGKREGPGWRISMDSIIAFNARYLLSTNYRYERVFFLNGKLADLQEAGVASAGRVRYITRQQFGTYER